MKLVGLMVVRNEDWVVAASLKAALDWCDEVVFVDHSSSDGTVDIYNSLAGSNPRRIHYSRWDELEHWNEMEVRQHSLLVARKHKATHCAIIDADEILTANLTDVIRGQIAKLNGGECLEVPMLAMRSLDSYQDDDSVWSKAWLTLAFRDVPSLSWQPDVDGYEHHHRAPYGTSGFKKFLSKKADGGVMHLQFANERRLLAKHWLYAYVDHLRWTGRETVNQLNAKYSQALLTPGKLAHIPDTFWRGIDRNAIDLDGLPWQESELRRLVAKHGEERFDGIKLAKPRGF